MWKKPPTPINHLDHFAIQNTIASYCIALDTKDFGLLSEVFTEDVYAKHPFRDAMTGRDTVSQAIQRRLGEVKTQHALTTQHILIHSSSSASTTTYFTGAHFGYGDFEGHVITAYGRYIDDLVCIGDGGDQSGYRKWRIQKRVVEFVKRIGDERIMEH